MKIAERTYYTSSQKRRISLGIFLILVFLGIIVGTIIVGTSENILWLNRLMFTNNMFKSWDKLSFLEQLFKDIVPLYAVLILQFFAGMFAFGQAFAVLTLIYRGAASGISAAIIYLVLGAKGFFAVILTVFPFAASSAFLVILGARESVRLSGNIAKYSFLQSGGNTPPDIKLYSLKFGILLIFGLLFSSADTLITYFLNPILFG